MHNSFHRNLSWVQNATLHHSVWWFMTKQYRTLYSLVTDKGIRKMERTCSFHSLRCTPLASIQSISVYDVRTYVRTYLYHITFRLNYWLYWIKKGFSTLNINAQRKTYRKKRTEKCKWKQHRHKEIFVWILWKYCTCMIEHSAVITITIALIW